MNKKEYYIILTKKINRFKHVVNDILNEQQHVITEDKKFWINNRLNHYLNKILKE